MPEPFQAAFQAPVVRRVGGSDVQFPLLVIDDYLPWCAELKAARTAEGVRDIPPKTPAFDRWRIEQYLKKTEPWLDDIIQLVRAPAGAVRVLEISLQKAGRPKDEAAAVARAVRPSDIVGLAEEVSQLFPDYAQPPADDDAGGGDPNRQAGGDPAGTAAGTGSNANG